MPERWEGDLKRIELSFDEPEPVEVVINGTSFVMTTPSGWSFMVMGEKVKSAPNEQEQLDILRGMFLEMMEPQEYERFAAFVGRPRGPSVDNLLKVFQRVVEESIAVPTTPSEGSANGQASDVSGSMDAASTADSTSSGSPSDGS